MKRVVIGAVVVLAVGLVWMVVRGRAVPVEQAEAAVRPVREYIAEDATTRLADEYLLAMPVFGTIKRIALDVGDMVEEGQLVGEVDPLQLEQQIRGVEAMVAQARAQIEGVNVTKPKPEDVEAAAKRVRESQDAERIAQEERAMTELEYAEAEKDYQRMQALHAQGAVSQAEFDAAERVFKQLSHGRERAQLVERASRAAREIAQLTSQRVAGSIDDNEYLRKMYQAGIEQLGSELEVLKSDLAKTRIVAPVTGPILEKYVEDELVLAIGTPLLKMGDLDSIEIECDVLSEEVGGIQVGNPVEVGGKALQGKAILGTVSRIYPAGFKKISSLGIEQQRVRTLIAFNNTDCRLRAGTSVEVKIITAEHAEALAIPERATFRQEGHWYVFAVHRGRARLTPVTLGLKNDDWAEIIEGLEPGQTVVAEPKNDLEDGVRVTGY